MVGMVSAAALVAGIAMIAAMLGASAQEGPSSGTSIASGLFSTGSAIGPDGALYVPLAGTGGDEEIELAPEVAEVAGADVAYFGLTGSVVRLDPDTGAQTTYAGEIPSIAFGEPGEGTGATDVTFNGDTLYVLVTGSMDVLGKEEYPNGVYELQGDGTWDLFANISEFNLDNVPDFADLIPGGNPFAIEARGTGFVVADGNTNRLMSISGGGSVSLLAQFENIVPTGLEVPSDSGPVWNTWFSPAPPGTATSTTKLLSAVCGAVTTVAGGFAQMIDIEQTDDGAVYVLQFADASDDPDAPPPPGRLLRLGDDGTLTPVVEGLMLATSLSFSGDTAFITSLTGEVYRIENVNDIPAIVPEPTPAPSTPIPPAPAPTPTVGGVITAPDTGHGPAAGESATSTLLAVALTAGVALLVGGTALRARR
jgi:hypothetical protein